MNKVQVLPRLNVHIFLFVFTIVADRVNEPQQSFLGYSPPEGVHDPITGGGASLQRLAQVQGDPSMVWAVVPGNRAQTIDGRRGASSEANLMHAYGPSSEARRTSRITGLVGSNVQIICTSVSGS